MILLDTTVLIDVLRQREPAMTRLQALFVQGPPPFVCAINVEEVWRGARPEEERAITDLFAGLRIAPPDRPRGRARRAMAAGVRVEGRDPGAA